MSIKIDTGRERQSWARHDKSQPRHLPLNICNNTVVTENTEANEYFQTKILRKNNK